LGLGRFAEGVLEAVDLARDRRGSRRVPYDLALSETR
jgi:hypothetical protein